MLTTKDVGAMMRSDLDIATPYVAEGGWEGDSAGELGRAETERTPAVEPGVATDDDVAEELEPDVEDADADEADEDGDSEGAAKDTDDVPDPEEADESKRQGKKRTWAARQAEEKRRVARIKTERETEERTLTETRRQHEALKREIATLQTEREQRKAPAPEPIVVGEAPDWDTYQKDNKEFDEFMRDYTQWSKQSSLADKQSVLAEATAKTSELLDQAREAGRTEAVKQLEERQSKEREQAIILEFQARRDDYFEKNPGVLDRGLETLKNLTSNTLTTIVQRHPNGMLLYDYLAHHPKQATAFQERIEPILTLPMMAAIKRSENPSTIVAYMTRNPAEVKRIADLPPADALMALGELNVTLRTGGVPQDASSRSAPRMTNAAPPLRHVAGRQLGTSDDRDEKHPDEWTQADWDRMRKKKPARR
ncbi:MAG: hypothetical protein H0W42_03045 [Gemmatimonadaceae bacterium]|nr:hypothetical protein [Gemmatimonadaceae bacterium]